MMARPFWSGQVQISLVSFAIDIFPAVEAKSEIHFHQLSRKTGQRVHHKKVTDRDEQLGNGDIVKGYEYRKGEYLAIEPEELNNLRIKSKQTIDIIQFSDLATVPPEYFERAYFLTPAKSGQAKAFAVMREALAKTKQAALGKIAFGGREHVIAIAAPADPAFLGMMAYTLHYAEELRDPAQYSPDTKQPQVRADELSLALELIERQTAPFQANKFTDEYEAAVKALVQSKLDNQPLPHAEREPKPGKVIDLMEALRKSIKARSSSQSEPASARKQASTRKGLTLVGSKSKGPRKSA